MRTALLSAVVAPGLAALTLTALTFAAPALAAGVTLPAAAQHRLGVEVQALAAAHRSGGITGFARVLDPVPLAALDADIAQAAAQAKASVAEALRTRKLSAADAAVSAKVAEAAAAQAKADSAKLTLLRRRLGLEWGPSFMGMTDTKRGDLMNQLAAGRAALVRIDAGTSLSHLTTAIIDLGPGEQAAVAILGPARTSDPRLLSTGLIGVVTGTQAARLGSGLTLPAKLSGGAGVSGVLLPRSALMRSGGATFAYVRTGAEHFERRIATATASEPGGLFAASGFKPGETIAVTGAAALYAAETAPKGDKE